MAAKYGTNSIEILKSVAEAFVEAGYNVVPVDREKRPVTRWAECLTRHCPELIAWPLDSKRSSEITGLALIGRFSPYPDKLLLLIDVDAPDKFPSGARDLLVGAWHWKTGPRCPVDKEKHGIECSEGVCRHGDHVFKAEETLRGEAYAVLIPAEAETLLPSGVVKALGGAVELRLRGYQLLPPSLHPSGVLYEWVVPPSDESGHIRPPKTLSLDEFRRLLELLSAGTNGEKWQVPQTRRGETDGGDKWRRLTPQAKERLVELLRPLYVPGHRQSLWLYLSGDLAKRRIDPKDCTEVLLRLHNETGDGDDLKMRGAAVVYSYAKAGHQGVKSLVAEALGVVPYGPEMLGTQRVKGFRGIKEVAVAVFSNKCAAGDDRCAMEAKAKALESVDEIRSLLGLRRRKMILISARGARAGKNAELYYANDPTVGLAIFKKYNVCRKECVEVNEKGKCVRKAEVCRAEWGFDVVAKHMYIVRGIMYVDPLSGQTLYSVKLRDLRTGKTEWLRFVTIDDIVQRIKQIGAVGVSNEELARVVQSILAETAKKIKRPPVAGVLPDPEGKPRIVAYGPYANRLKQMLNTRGDPAKFVELLDRFYRWDPKALDAYAVGMYSAFNSFRKLRGLRNKWAVLSGEAGTGKTQLAKTIVSYIFNLPEEGEAEGGVPSAIHSAGALLSPARLSRDLAFTTFPKLFDEGRTLTFYNPAVADTIKRAINGLFAYETASAGSLITRQYPAYASAIITTQSINVTDPGLRTKLYTIEFTHGDVKRGHEEFLKWREEHREDLRAFGKFYIETIIRERADLLEVDEDNYVWAARETLRHVLVKLGVPEEKIRFPEAADESGGEFDEDELATFVKWLTKTCRAHLLDLPANERVNAEDPADVVEHVLRKFGGLKVVDVVVDSDVVKIGRDVVDKIGGTSLKNLAEKINIALGKEVARYAKLGGRKRLTIDFDSLRALVKAYA